MNKNIFYMVGIVLLAGKLFAQTITSEMFPVSKIHEDFLSENNNWPIVTSTENYFVFDKGDYLLSRSNKENDYAILAANGASFKDFALQTNIRIGPSVNPLSNLGIILKAQQDGKGAIIIEFNRNKNYRIKQLKGNVYNFLSGNNHENGWIKSSLLASDDNANTIEIRSKNNLFELYINGKYETSFYLNDYQSGAVGFILGPETKARIAHFYLNMEGENNANNTENNAQTTNAASLSADIMEKTQTIIKLESDIAKLNQKIKTLESDMQAIKKDQETLQLQNKSLNDNNDKLLIEIGQAENKQTEIVSLQEKIKQNEEELVVLRNESAKLKTANIRIAQLEKETNENNRNNTNTISTLNSKAEQLNQNIQSLEQEKAVLNNKISSLQKELNQEKENNKQNQSDLAKNIAEQKVELDGLTKSLNTEKSKKAIGEKENASLKSEISKLEEENKALIAKNSSDRSSFKNKEVEYQQNIHQLQQKNEQQTKELQSVNSILNNQKNKIESIDAIIITSKNKEEELISQNNSSKAIIAEQNIKIKLLTDSIAKKAEQYDELQSFMVKQGIIKNGGTQQIPSTQINIQETLKRNEFYSVQLGVFLAPIPEGKFSAVKNIYQIKTADGVLIYLSGEYSSLQEAIQQKNALRKSGVNDVFVVKVIDKRTVITVE